jgi:hypothetical protein
LRLIFDILLTSVDPNIGEFGGSICYAYSSKS